MNTNSFEITKKDFLNLYNILIINYLELNKSYDDCVNEAFEYLIILNQYLPIDKPFRLQHNLNGLDAYHNFYVDFNTKKIIYEGIISIKAIHQMRLIDVYICGSDIDDLCDKYHLERKSKRKNKIEKLLNNA